MKQTIPTGEDGRQTGVPVSLLNAVTLAEATLLLHSLFWFTQEMFDGQRMLLRKRGTVIEAINREGLTVGAPQPVFDAATACQRRDFLLDGELVGDTLYVFDLLEMDGADMKPLPYHYRLERLYELMFWLPADAAIETVETTDSPVKALAMFKQVQARGGRGVVFKRSDAVHSGGRPASEGPYRKYEFPSSKGPRP